MKRPLHVLSFAVAALALPAILSLMPGDARACGTFVALEGPSSGPRPAGPTPTQLVSRAEQALSEGKPAQAALSAVAAFPALRKLKLGALPLTDRALRIMALAAVRTDGAASASGFPVSTAAERTANVVWSIRVLRGLEARRNNNPANQTDLGEGLARLPEFKAEAAELLSRLADKDLLTSAEGYAALARLRAERGDKAARDALVKRCEAMTKTPAIVCDVPVVVESGSQT